MDPAYLIPKVQVILKGVLKIRRFHASQKKDHYIAAPEEAIA
jgi:hypothetical protein